VLHEVLIVKSELVGTFLKNDFDWKSYSSQGFEQAVAVNWKFECWYNFHSIDDWSL